MPPEVLHSRLRDARELHPSTDEPVSVPVVRFGPATTVWSAPEQAQEWRKVTSGEFSFIEFPGDHMYLVDRAQEVLDLIEAKSVDG